jgi:hypothetical protein
MRARATIADATFGAVFATQFLVELDATASDLAVADIDEMQLVYDQEEMR